MLLMPIIPDVVILLYLSITERFGAYILLIALQGWILGFVTLTQLHSNDRYKLIFVMAKTMVFKALIVSWMLLGVILNTGINGVHTALVGGLNRLIVSMLFLLAGIFVTHHLAADSKFDMIFFGVLLYALLWGMLLFFVIFNLSHRLIRLGYKPVKTPDPDLDPDPLGWCQCGCEVELFFEDRLIHRAGDCRTFFLVHPINALTPL